MKNTRVTEVQCKTVLNKCPLSFADYTLNAYQGCPFACSYCYVPIMRERFGLSDLPWGSWVSVKVNAPSVLRQEVRRIRPEASIAIGTASDSWQPAEKRYRVARQILEVLAEQPNPVSLVTRSPLILRDLDVLSRLEEVRVGISLPSFDARVHEVFEPWSPSFESRVTTIRRLVDAGLSVQVFFCPILPGVMDTESAIRAYMKEAGKLGVRSVVAGPMNYLQGVMPRHRQLLREFRSRFGPPRERSLEGDDLKVEIAYWAKLFGVRIARELPKPPPRIATKLQAGQAGFRTGVLPLS